MRWFEFFYFFRGRNQGTLKQERIIGSPGQIRTAVRGFHFHIFPLALFSCTKNFQFFGIPKSLISWTSKKGYPETAILSAVAQQPAKIYANRHRDLGH
jgi:hypothetical protein